MKYENNPNFDYQKMVSIVNALGISQSEFDKYLDSKLAEGILGIEKGQCSISKTDYRNSANDMYRVYDNAEECFQAFVDTIAYWETIAANNPSYRISYPTRWEEFDECENKLILHPGHVIKVFHKGKIALLFYMVNHEYD